MFKFALLLLQHMIHNIYVIYHIIYIISYIYYVAITNEGRMSLVILEVLSRLQVLRVFVQ